MNAAQCTLQSEGQSNPVIRFLPVTKSAHSRRRALKLQNNGFRNTILHQFMRGGNRKQNPMPYPGFYHRKPMAPISYIPRQHEQRVRSGTRNRQVAHMALPVGGCIPCHAQGEQSQHPPRTHGTAPGKCAGATPSIQVPAERILRGALGTAPAGPGCSNPLAVQPRAQHNWIVSQSGPSQTCVSTLVDDLAVFCLTARFDSPQLLFQKKQALL